MSRIEGIFNKNLIKPIAPVEKKDGIKKEPKSQEEYIPKKKKGGDEKIGTNVDIEI